MLPPSQCHGVSTQFAISFRPFLWRRMHENLVSVFKLSDSQNGTVKACHSQAFALLSTRFLPRQQCGPRPALFRFLEPVVIHCFSVFIFSAFHASQSTLGHSMLPGEHRAACLLAATTHCGCMSSIPATPYLPNWLHKVRLRLVFSCPACLPKPHT